MSKTGNQHVNKLKIEDTDLHVVPVPGTYEFNDGVNYLTSHHTFPESYGDSAVVALTAGDVIKLKTRNTLSTDNITFKHCTVAISKC